MRHFQRTDKPDFLAQNDAIWNARYKTAKDADTGHQWSWPQLGGDKVNHLIVAALVPLTTSHCAYCDAEHLGASSRDTLDHFCPKSEPAFYHLVCEWDNLYLCCDACQQAKLEKYDADLLRPDASDYSFGRFFDYEVRSGKILANPGAPEVDRQRAETTIRIFGFNKVERCEARKTAVRRAQGMNPSKFVLDDHPYRFAVELTR